MKNQPYGIIYRAMCLTTGKSYVGQTTGPLKYRVRQHEYAAMRRKRHAKFQVAMRRHGIDSFIWGEVATAPDAESLAALEEYYIFRFDTFENGYNSNPGGQIYTPYSDWQPEIPAESLREQAEEDRLFAEIETQYVVHRELRRFAAHAVKVNQLISNP